MFIFCLKSSHTMGMGHFFRLLNLYQSISRYSVEVVFVLLGRHTPAENWLKKRKIVYELVVNSSLGWEVEIVKRYSPCVWVNDRLDTNEEHVQLLKSLGLIVVSFDDAGSGAQYLDLQIAALAPARNQKMQGYRVLSGLGYLILPQEISNYRRVRTSDKKLVVNLGGSDTYGITIRIVKWLQERQKPATVILGPGFMHEKELNEVMTGGFITVKRSVPSLSVEFSYFDLAITGGGLTAFEAAATGLPTMTIANELHEIDHCKYLQALGCSKYAGFRDESNLKTFDDFWDIESMSRAGINQVSLNGAEELSRVFMALYSETMEE